MLLILPTPRTARRSYLLASDPPDLAATISTQSRRVAANGGPRVRVTDADNLEEVPSSPAHSPDGTTIAYDAFADKDIGTVWRDILIIPRSESVV